MLGSPCGRGCLVGLLATFLIALLRTGLDPLLGDESPRLLFTLPILAAACLGGWLPGLLTTGLCMVVIVFLFIEPRYSLSIAQLADQVALTTFLMLGICITTLCEWMRRHKQEAETARNLAEQQRRQLEQEVIERQATEMLWRASEQRWRTIVEASTPGLILVARDGSIVLTNTSAEEMFGFSKQELVGHPIEVLLPGRFRDNHVLLRQEFFHHPRIVKMAGVRHLWAIRRDGTEFPVEVGLGPVEMEDGLCVLASVVDISARRTAEEALQQLNAELEQRVAERTAELRDSEQRFRRIFEHASIGITITSFEGTIGLCNAAYCQILGYPPEELQRLHFAELIHPDDLADNLARIQPLTTGQVSRVEVENRYLHRDGSAVWVHKIVSLLVDRQGKPSHFLVLVTDISARRRTEAALRESEARFRSAFELAPIGMSLVTPDGRYLQVNRPLCAIIGYTESELLASRYQTHLHPDDLPQALAGSQRLLTGETDLETVELRCLHKTGTIRLVQFTVSLYRNPEGHPQYFISHVIDITQRKTTERDLADQQAVLRQFVKHMPAAVAMFDREMHYLHLSDRWLLDAHLTDHDLIGRNHYEVFPRLPQHLRESHQRALAGSVETCEEEKFLLEDGSPLWLQWEHRPWYDAAGAIGGMIIFVLNITARHLAEEKLRASLREQEVLLREVHHRVKNNLQVISTLLDLQSDHTQDRQALEMFRESRDRVKAMALMHERMYRSKDRARIHFAEYADQLITDLKRNYRTPGLEISLRLTLDGPSLPLDQAIPCGLLLNELVSNCFKHAFVGRTEGAVEVTLRQENAFCVLSVADNGVGLPAHLDFRAASSFGLQLVQTLVAQLHGTIDLVGDAGARFVVRFPNRE